VLDVIAMDEADEEDDEDAEELVSLLLDVNDELIFIALLLFVLDVACELSTTISANLLLLLLVLVSNKELLLSFTVIVVPDVIESKFDGVNCVQAFDIVLI
jgi:hypothetical protein